MPVEITDRNPIVDNPQTGTAKVWIMRDRTDPRAGNAERSVFDMVQMLGTVVRTGMVIGRPA